jgi:hypothetical protein
MKKRAAKNHLDEEPIGIVISNGGRSEHAPLVWAYVWGPAPDDLGDDAESKAP